MKTSLIAGMLATDRNEFLLVDTVEKAMKWNIELYDYPKMGPPSARNLVQACYNFQKWKRDSVSDVVEEWLISLSLKKSTAKNMRGYYRVDTGGLVDSYCDITFSNGNFTICSTSEFSGISHGGCPKYGFVVPTLYGLPPNFKIEKLVEINAPQRPGAELSKPKPMKQGQPSAGR